MRSNASSLARAAPWQRCSSSRSMAATSAGGSVFFFCGGFTLFGMRDINAMNGLKMALVGIMTITAIVAFVVANVVRWPETLPMLAGSAVGSYMAAHWAQRLDQRLIKGFVVVLGVALTVYFA